MKLIVPTAQIDTALSILHRQGYTASRNGHGIWVRVEPDHKAAPIYALADRDIFTESFEIDSSDPAEQRHDERH